MKEEGLKLNLKRELWRTLPEVKLLGRTIIQDNSTPAAILDTFEALGFETKAGLKPVLTHKHRTPYGWHLILRLPPGISGKDVEVKLNHFQEQSGGTVALEMKGAQLHMDINTLQLPRLVSYEYPETEMRMPLPVGYSQDGMIFVDLADIPHLFVAGNTGSGKSGAIHAFANTLIRHGAQVIIIDLKRLEFSYLRNHALVARTDGEAEQVLRQINREMDRRLDILERSDCLNLKEYRGGDLPFTAVIIDELTELQSEKAQKDLNRLARLARSPGISLICATQRPSATTYKNFTDTRALFSARLCFSVADATNSQIVLGNDLAAQIPKDIPGRGVWQWDRQIIVQAPYLSIKRAREIVKGIPGKVVELTNESSRGRLQPR